MLARDFSALHAFIDSRKAVPHAWGREANDCVGYVLAAVKALTGVEVAPEAQWSGEAEARKLIAGFGSIEAAFDAHFDRVPPSLAMRGDIAGVADSEFGVHPWIVEGVTLVGPGERGNGRLARKAMIVAWSAVSARP